MVEELSSYTAQDLADLDALMHELSATSFCDELLLSNVIDDANVHVYVIRDEGHLWLPLRFVSSTLWSLL